jgi:hypothetical protein
MKRALKPWWQNCMLVADEFRTRLGRSFEQANVRYPVRNSLHLGDLEPRLLFSATPIDLSALVGVDSSDAMAMVATSEQTHSLESNDRLDSSSQAGTSTIRQTNREVIFIDSAVPDLAALLDDLSGSDRQFDVFVLDANRDGVEQISEVLKTRSDVRSLHVISHSEDNAIKLGNVWLGDSNLDGYAGQIAFWKQGLASDADILLYGCDLASNESGRSFVEALSELTETDVAASDDDTGHHTYRGDWDLEYQTGAIETSVALSSNFQDEWFGKLATITVTTTSDDVNLDMQTSLREAIIQANAGGGGDTIVLSAGLYSLNRVGNDAIAFYGDLDIRSTITIQGAGVGQTIIDGGGIDRVFEVTTNLSSLTLTNLTVQGGSTGGFGGGIFVQHGNSTLSLQNVVVTSNTGTQGAGIYSNGAISLDNVVVSGNGDGGTVKGGGIFINGDATLNRVTVHGNYADKGAGIYSSGSATVLTNVTVSGNTATSNGGGLFNDGDIAITNSTFAYNGAESGGGIFNQGGGNIDLLNTIVSDNVGTLENPDVQGTVFSSGFNLIENTTGATGFISSDLTGMSAGLGVLGNNGGTTPTHSLVAGSVAINAGTSVGSPSTDQRGFTRGSTPDIGAFELQSPTLTSQGETRVNQTTSDEQSTAAANRGSTHAVSLAADGSYVVVWTSLNQDGSGKGVYARRFDASGNALTGEILVNEQTTNDQQWARVVSQSDGSFIVTWTSNRYGDQDLFFRRFGANGTPTGSEVRVNTTASFDQWNSDISSNKSTGDFVIVWQGNGGQLNNVDDNGVFGQRYDSDGSAIGSEFRVNTVTSGTQGDVSVSMNSNNEFVVVWDDASGMHFQRYNSSGGVIGTQGTSDNSASAGNGSVAMNNDGSFVVVWREGAGGSKDVYLQRYDNTGTAIGTNTIVSDSSLSDQSSPSISMDSSGSFIIVWDGNGTQSGHEDTVGVFGQKFLSNGTRIGDEFRVNATTSGTQQYASVAMIDINNFVVVWTGNGNESGQVDNIGVFSRQYSGTPGPSGPTDIVLSNVSVGENALGTTVGNVLVVDPDALAVHTWSVSDTRFEVVGNQLKLKSGQTLDFESEPTLNLTLTVTDQAGSGIFYNETFMINVSNVNEAPSDITLSNLTVSENASGAVIGNVGVSDPDSSDTHVWSVSDSRFEVVGNQLKLKSGQTLNFESEPTLNLTLTVTDQAGSGRVYDEAFMINVSNVNEAPTDITLSNLAVSENASGAVIGNVGVSDPDSSDTHVWSVNDTRFEIVGNQLKLRSNQAVDYSQESAINVVVTVRDQSGFGLSYTESMTIDVVNQNLAPTGITLSNASIQGNSQGAVIGDLAVIDPNTDDAHTLAVNDQRFQVVNGILKLKPGQSLASHLEPSLNLTITATDERGQSFSKLVTIAVLPPQVIILPNSEPSTSSTNSNTSAESNANKPTEAPANTQERPAGESNESTEPAIQSDSGDGSRPSAIALMMGSVSQTALGGAVELASLVTANLSLQNSSDARSGEQEFLGDANQGVSSVQTAGYGSRGISDVARRFSDELRRLGIGDLQSIAFHSTDTLLMSSGEMWQELDQQKNKVESYIQGDLIVIGAAGAAASSFTAGLVAWGLRTGFLASGLLAQMPAWRAFDPLLIMQGAGEGDDESLEDLMKRRSDELDNLENDGEAEQS